MAYASSSDYHFAIVWNGVMFLIASLASQVHLGRAYAPLIALRPRHRHGKTVWLTLYVFVTIQLAWVLRPFVGSPGLETTFLREGVWDNAYVVVIRDVWTLLTKYVSLTPPSSDLALWWRLSYTKGLAHDEDNAEPGGGPVLPLELRDRALGASRQP